MVKPVQRVKPTSDTVVQGNMVHPPCDHTPENSCNIILQRNQTNGVINHWRGETRTNYLRIQFQQTLRCANISSSTSTCHCLEQHNELAALISNSKDANANWALHTITSTSKLKLERCICQLGIAYNHEPIKSQQRSN